MHAARVLSVGYERRTVAELIDLLTSRGVEKLVDVREAPISRRKGFSKKALAEQLEESGITYLHLRAAGNPYRKLNADIDRCLDLYAAYLGENPEVLDLVAAELTGCFVAVLCYEREHDCCHRSVLLDALARGGRELEILRLE